MIDLLLLSAEFLALIGLNILLVLGIVFAIVAVWRMLTDPL